MASVGEFVSETTSRLRTQYNNDTICSIWEYVCQFIEKQLLTGKGVSISNLGTFTFCRKTLHVGNGVLAVQRPIFNLSTQLAQMYQLISTKHHTSGDVSVIPLNFSAVALETPFPRQTIQDVVDLIVSEIPRALQKDKKVNLLLNGIGRMRISKGEAKFCFFREFLNTLDDSGTTEQVMRLNTGGTATRANPSVMSRNKSSAAASSRATSTVMLPRLVSSGGRVTLSSPSNANPAVSSIKEADDEEDHPMETGDEVKTGSGDLDISLESGKHHHSDASSTESSPKTTERRNAPLSSCGHENAGQELCYLCHQRASRNVPVSFDKEKSERAFVDERLQAEYQRRDQEVFLARERARAVRGRFYATEAHTYNMEAAQEKKDLKMKPTGFEASFLMQQRPLSQHKSVMQTVYGEDLKSQMDMKAQEELDRERQRQLDERLEQIMLARQLASSHKSHMERKNKIANEYRQTLRQQIEEKANSIRYSGPEVVGTPSYNTQLPSIGKRTADREAARRVMHEQQQLSALKRKKAEEREGRQKEKEREMLIRARKDLLADMAQEGEVRQQQMKDLVDSWKQEKQAKEKRDFLDKEAQHHNPAHLLDLCQYDRCHQCQRDKGVGAGTTHVHKDNYFKAGFTVLS